MCVEGPDKYTGNHQAIKDFYALEAAKINRGN